MNKLTIRCRPLDGESLTSFILYVGMINKIEVSWIINRIEGVTIESLVKHMDFRYTKIDGFESVLSIIGLEQIEWSSMTFYPILQYFLDEDNLAIEHYLSFLNDAIVFTHRRFCPMCIKKTPRYKLKWQVKDYIVCDEHLIHIQDYCNTCGKKQPYVHSMLVEGRCYHCLNDLSDDVYTCEVIENNQIWINDTYRGVENNYQLDKLSKNRSLAIRLLYYLQNKSMNFNYLKIGYATNKYKSGLYKIALGEMTSFLTLGKIIYFLKQLNISMDEFLSIIIPTQYIHSLIMYKKTREIVCLSQWCIGYMNSNSLIPIQQISIDKVTYYDPLQCRMCYEIYIMDKDTNQIKRVSEIYSIAWKKIYPLYMKGYKIQQISRIIKVPSFKVSKWLMYLYNQKLIKIGNSSNIELEISDEIEEKFSELSLISGYKITKSQELYGWSRKQYYYYYFHPKIYLKQIVDRRRRIEVTAQEKVKKRNDKKKEKM